MTEVEKKELSRVVKLAKGSQSLDEFAEKTGISKFQLSRIINGKLKGMPRKSTLQAICDNSENSEATLLLSVSLQTTIPGFIDGEEVQVPNNVEKTLSTMLNGSFYRTTSKRLQQAQQCVLGNIMYLTNEWITRRNCDPLNYEPPDSDFPNRHLQIEFTWEHKIKKWYFYILDEALDSSDSFFYTFLGKLACYPSSPEEKFSIVVTSPEIYDQLENKSINFHATVSIIFIDISPESGYLPESYLELADGITDNDLLFLQIF